MIGIFAKLLPRMKNSGEVLSILYNWVSQVFDGKCSIEEALNKAEQEILPLV